MDYEKLREKVTKIVHGENSIHTFRHEILINNIMQAVKKCEETEETPITEVTPIKPITEVTLLGKSEEEDEDEEE